MIDFANGLSFAEAEEAKKRYDTYPNMYEALKEAIEALSYGDGISTEMRIRTIKKLKNVLAKAEGKA